MVVLNNSTVDNSKIKFLVDDNAISTKFEPNVFMPQGI
jgi:hypothetical protein